MDPPSRAHLLTTDDVNLFGLNGARVCEAQFKDICALFDHIAFDILQCESGVALTCCYIKKAFVRLRIHPDKGGETRHFQMVRRLLELMGDDVPSNLQGLKSALTMWKTNRPELVAEMERRKRKEDEHLGHCRDHGEKMKAEAEKEKELQAKVAKAAKAKAELDASNNITVGAVQQAPTVDHTETTDEGDEVVTESVKKKQRLEAQNLRLLAFANAIIAAGAKKEYHRDLVRVLEGTHPIQLPVFDDNFPVAFFEAIPIFPLWSKTLTYHQRRKCDSGKAHACLRFMHTKMGKKKLQRIYSKACSDD